MCVRAPISTISVQLYDEMTCGLESCGGCVGGVVPMESLVQKVSGCHHTQRLAAGELHSIALHSVVVDAFEFSHFGVDV